jgi:hypothetical protein
LVNAKLIPSILPNYIPPLAGTVSHDSVLRDFDYTLITAYLPKGIHVVGLQLGQIMMLKISDSTWEIARTMECSPHISI